MTPTDALTRWQAVVSALRERIARAEAATEGPWVWKPVDEDERESPVKSTYSGDALFSGDIKVHTDGSAYGEYGADIDTAGPDAAFIAAARQEHPAAHRALLEIAERHGPDSDEARHCRCCAHAEHETGRLLRSWWPCDTFRAVERAVGLGGAE